jgi:hypothetical protein
MPLSNPQLHLQFSPFAARIRDEFDRMQAFIGSDEFTFVVNGKGFVIRLTDALLLSSNVCEWMRNDVNCRSFEIETRDAQSEDFGTFLSFVRCSGSVEAVVDSDGTFLLFCGLVGNDSLPLLLLWLLHSLVSASARSGDPSMESALQRISFCDADADVDFCASRFYLYSAKELQKLDRSVLHRILASSRLSLLTEDAFLRLLLHLGGKF